MAFHIGLEPTQDNPPPAQSPGLKEDSLPAELSRSMIVPVEQTLPTNFQQNLWLLGIPSPMRLLSPGDE